jgi:hypothetical protein
MDSDEETSSISEKAQQVLSPMQQTQFSDFKGLEWLLFTADFFKLTY